MKLFLLRLRELTLHESRHLLGGDLASVGPVHGREAENIAEAVVADGPSLGEPADDVPRRVEAHQPLGDIREQYLVGR